MLIFDMYYGPHLLNINVILTRNQSYDNHEKQRKVTLTFWHGPNDFIHFTLADILSWFHEVVDRREIFTVALISVFLDFITFELH